MENIKKWDDCLFSENKKQICRKHEKIKLWKTFDNWDNC